MTWLQKKHFQHTCHKKYDFSSKCARNYLAHRWPLEEIAGRAYGTSSDFPWIQWTRGRKGTENERMEMNGKTGELGCFAPTTVTC